MHRSRQLLMGLVFSTGLAASAGAAELQPTTMIESWFIHAESIGDPVAVEKGFYRDAGLDVTVVPGGPGLSPIGRVMAEARSGKLVFGIDYPHNLLEARQRQQLDLIILAADFQNSAMRILSWKKINTVDDIRGPFATWIGYDKPIKAAIGKDWPNRIQIVNQQGDPATLGGWIAKQYDFASAMIYNEVLVARKVVKEPYYVYAYPQFGVDWQENVLFTTESVLKKFPEQVKAFVHARYQGYKYALDHPDEAGDILLKYNANLDKDFELQGLEQIRTIMVTDATKEHGLGYLDVDRLQTMAKQLKAAEILDSDSIEGLPHAIPSGVMP